MAVESPYPLDNLTITTTDLESWLAERERRGARKVSWDKVMNDGGVIFNVSTSDEIAEPCVEMQEFMSAAARSAAAAVEVLDRLTKENDPHLVAALKRYVEEIGQALKEVDNRLKVLHSGLNELLPDISSWRSLIGRRDVIAHQILTVDDEKIREEADKDFRALCQLLPNIHFCPTVIDLEQTGFAAHFKGNKLFGLIRQEGGENSYGLGGALILVYLDIQKGIVTFRLGLDHDNRMLIAGSHPGNLHYRISKRVSKTVVTSGS